MRIKEVDPVKVAELSEHEFILIVRAVDILNSGVREPEFPAELYAPAFHILRKIGASNVRSYDGMRIAALVFNHRRLTIDRLREYGPSA